MELQFQNRPLDYLRTLTRQKQSTEQTQELRLPDGMPDIGQVLGCWGQVVLRSKQWNSSSLSLSAGVMVWILYVPEEGGNPCTMETWIPFQQKFELPETGGREGSIHCDFQLTVADARNTSARKLFVRVCVDTLLEAFIGERAQLYTPDEIPEDVQLLQNTYPVVMAVEAGEKPFEMEENLRLPESCPAFKKMVYYKIYPKVQEKKILGDKVVFRGSALVHMLYMADDDMLYSWDFDVPFSQYGELEREYEPDAGVDVRMVLTSQELQPDEQGNLQLAFGLTGQYMIRQRTMVPVTEDVYSTARAVDAKKEQLPLPAILDRQEQRITAQQTLPTDSLRIADVSFCCRNSGVGQDEERAKMELGGQFQVLCYDIERKLTAQTAGWEQPWSLLADPDSCVNVHITCEPAQALMSAGGVNAENDLLLDIQTISMQPMETISALELGEELVTEGNRPSLIICRAGKEGLWSVAKSVGSTVEAIRKANKLEQEPEENQMLLIPISR